MRPVARDTDDHACPAAELLVFPHMGGCILPAAQVEVQAEHMQVARLADYAVCIGPQDVLFEGASTVLASGLPLAGLGHRTNHTGTITTGAATVMVGGPTFALPSNLFVKGDAAFRNAVVRDLYYLSTLPSGRELIDRLEKAGHPVTFIPTAVGSRCSASLGKAASLGIPGGSTIEYNPAVSATKYDAGGNPIASPPQATLAHEMVHAMNNAEGNNHDGPGLDPRIDPAPPKSEPNIEEEEAAAVGTGSHSHDYPTENSVRSDMGLPRRDNHRGGAPAPPGNFRPGGY